MTDAAKILPSTRGSFEDELIQFCTEVKNRRATVDEAKVEFAMRHRGHIRCLNEGREILNDMEEVLNKGPVIEFELTSRGRLSAR